MNNAKNKFQLGDVVEYERYNAYYGWEIVKRVIRKITKYSIILDDDVLSNKGIQRLKKVK